MRTRTLTRLGLAVGLALLLLAGGSAPAAADGGTMTWSVGQSTDTGTLVWSFDAANGGTVGW